MTKRIVYVKLRHPTGRVTTRGIKVKATTLKGVQREYLGTSDHFRTEAFPIAITKKPIRKKARQGSLFGGYKF